MNAVLQCLTHTPPLAQLCLLDAGLSTSTADKQHMDPIAAMQAHVKKALTASNPVRPMWHAKNLKAINRRCVGLAACGMGLRLLVLGLTSHSTCQQLDKSVTVGSRVQRRTGRKLCLCSPVSSRAAGCDCMGMLVVCGQFVLARSSCFWLSATTQPSRRAVSSCMLLV